MWGRQRLQREVAHLEEHVPLPTHQLHVPASTRTAFAGELRGARRAVAGRVPEEAALQVNLALVLALGAHLDGALGSWLSSSVSVHSSRSVFSQSIPTLLDCFATRQGFAFVFVTMSS